MTETKSREKGPLPFYELPKHIKPCSQIIQETRLQLKYSAKIGSDIDPALSSCPGSGKRPFRTLSSGDGGDYVGYLPRPAMSSFSNYGSLHMNLESSHSSSSLTALSGGTMGPLGIHAVHTKRPFTPRDSIDLWGMSARKRPPSAITLSRLSLDEERSRPSSRLGKLGRTSGFKNIRTAESFDLNLTGTEVESDIEKARIKLKALSTVLDGQDGRRLESTPEMSSDYSMAAHGSNSHENQKETMMDIPSNTFPQMSQMTQDHLDQIDSLAVAMEYLNSYLELGGGKSSRDDLIHLLRRVKIIITLTNPTTMESLKGRLTKIVFKIVERNSNDEDILFWASFILLHCQIIGNNLTTVFKMVFKASRSKTYWNVIQESEYLDVFMYALGEICPLTQTESMIYGYGTLKFICAEEGVLNHVIGLNMISIMVLHLKILNYEVNQMKKVPERIQNGVFQLTSILRSVVGIESSLISVAETGLLDEICDSLVWTIEDIDAISNIVRILSVVSSNELCCEMLSENQSLCPAVVKILKIWHSKDSIVVRLTYCLGNLLAKHDGIRIKLYQEPLALEMIIQVIGYYMENFSESSIDILIKSIRILANWSLCPKIGRDLCEVDRVSEILNNLLEAEEGVSNELLLCTISTLNNLSYHKDCSKLDLSNIKTAECLYNYLNLKNIEIRTETMKVLGNFTRNEVIRRAAAGHIGTILTSLEGDNPELLCATIGVLMNIVLEEEAKIEFLRKQGVKFLISLMETKEDAGVNLMICQLIWNLVVSDIDDTTGKERPVILSQTDMEDLYTQIENRLKQFSNILKENHAESEIHMEKVKGSPCGDSGVEGGDDESYHEICIEYVAVAQNLLEKLSSIIGKM